MSEDGGAFVPLQEISMSVGLAGSAQLSVIDYAAMCEFFKDQFPVFQQTEMVGPLVVAPGQSALQFGASSPRIWLSTSEGHLLAQFQHDRISLNWRRLLPYSSRVDYPGYDAIVHRFEGYFGAVRNWLKERLDIQVEPISGELAYVNAIPLNQNGTEYRISEIVPFYCPREKRKVIGFNFQWAEQYSERPEGYMYIQTTVGATMHDGVVVIPNVAARFNLTSPAPADIIADFARAHVAIHEVMPHLIEEQFRETFQ